ncbi:MAG TPA: outer membrane beta-barrel protein [Polyangiaceae bacterium]|nr:outer membrane beta-barrel protein [Polyangiaceae bacterium]
MMKRIVGAGLAAVTLLGAGAAAAAPNDAGPDLGLRLGYGIAMGDAAKNAAMSDGVKGQIPIWIDAGYRFNPNIMAGLYFSYGFAQLADKACPSGADCSAHDMRLGIQGQYRFSPGENINPWVGVGFGLEWAGYSASAGGAEAKSSFNGIEFLDLQGGADFKVADCLGIGPFLSFSLGQYNSGSVTVPGLGTVDGDITNKAMHEWLMFGVRGVFEL